jgi:hypothetical protein
MKTLSLLAILAAAAVAHELQENRATLVLRDNTHLSVTLYIAYGEALRLALAPKRSEPEFLVMYSAMRPDRLQKELLRAQAKFQSDTHLYLSMGRELPLTNWVWPDVPKVQALMQQRVMQAMVDPGGHSHEEPLEIHADANSQQEILTARVQFPEEFRKVLVVAYRPTQQWAEPHTLSPVIRF